MGELVSEVSSDDLKQLCAKWQIAELSIFGSALREDFAAHSDVDILVAFEPDAPWTYMDWPELQDELSALFGGRSIDLVERKTLRNPFIRNSVLTSRKILYAA
jgi:predicted nucleotidyltransferase